MLATAAPPFPPQSLMFMGETEEAALRNGDLLLSLVEGTYDRSGVVLDIGCGYGRLAYALLRSGFAGEYVGIDVMPHVISWLAENFSPAEPRFQFLRQDVNNGRYNREGSLDSAQFALPALRTPPAMVLAVSVFTHMYEREIRRYLEVISEVMSLESVLYATFFLTNDDQRALMAQGNAAFTLDNRLDDHTRFLNKEDPLHVIAYEEANVRAWLTDAGLYIDRALYGSWCGRRRTPAYQDTLLLRRIRV